MLVNDGVLFPWRGMFYEQFAESVPRAVSRRGQQRNWRWLRRWPLWRALASRTGGFTRLMATKIAHMNTTWLRAVTILLWHLLFTNICSPDTSSLSHKVLIKWQLYFISLVTILFNFPLRYVLQVASCNLSVLMTNAGQRCIVTYNQGCHRN